MSLSWVQPFLVQLARCGIVAEAARVANVSSSTPHARRVTDADFAAAWEQAMEDHTDACEAELTRRAFGYEEPVVYQGQLTPVWETDEDGHQVLRAFDTGQIDKEGKPVMGQRPVQAVDEQGRPRWLTITKHSDMLLLSRVKAYRKRYSTDRTELTGAEGGALDVRVMDRTARGARVAALMALAGQRKAEKDDAQQFGNLA